MPYVVIKPMKVQKADGTIEIRQPGEAVPEADGWANPGIWVKRGFLAPTDQATANASGYMREKLKPMVEAGEDAAQRAEAPVPQPGQPLPGYQGQSAPEVVDGEEDPMAELLGLNRGDLNALAEDCCVEDPEKMPNKAAVAEAILAAQTGLEGAAG
jgi:hypothetical protein